MVFLRCCTSATRHSRVTLSSTKDRRCQTLAANFSSCNGGVGSGRKSSSSHAVICRVARRRLIPVSNAYDGDKFFTVVDGVRLATPLLLVLAVVELSDVVFAVDSIPAVRV